MKYEIMNDRIRIFGKDQFDSRDILESGQVFRYSKMDEKTWEVRVSDRQAVIVEDEIGFEMFTSEPHFFVEYFDLDTDYSEIKKNLVWDKNIARAIRYGEGVRLLRAPFFETAVSFIISANNNIKRIQLILNRLCEALGERKKSFFAFPTVEKLLAVDESFWRGIGAGYRSRYLPKAIYALSEIDTADFEGLETKEIRKRLVKLPGIGVKVADCILLFGVHRFDVFPVDVWIEKSYHSYFESGLVSRAKMSEVLVQRFGTLSGYAQQYIYNYRKFIQ